MSEDEQLSKQVATEEKRPHSEERRLLAELIGTFALTLVAAGVP